MIAAALVIGGVVYAGASLDAASEGKARGFISFVCALLSLFAGIFMLVVS